MSTWYEVANEDIDIDHKDKEVAFLVFTDNCGNTYLSVSFDQIKEIAKKIGD